MKKKKKENYVELSVGDGTTMHAYVARPTMRGEQFPALMLFQEAFGVNPHIRNLAERFAAEGYVVIAPELFHRTAPLGFEESYTDFAAITPHIQGLTQDSLEADINATWNWLQQDGKVHHDCIGSTGYCMGGRVSFLANTMLPLKAAISYYGSRIVPDLIKKADHLHGPMMFFWGGLDKHIPQEQIAAVMDGMNAAGKPYINTVISYADHGFFCDARASYNEQAAKEAWSLTLAFLKNKLV
jgi:carboxymethylenebutenolidase